MQRKCSEGCVVN